MDDIYDNKSDESLLMNSSRGMQGELNYQKGFRTSICSKVDSIQNSNSKGPAPHGIEEFNSSPHHGETAGIAATETAER